MRYEDFKGFNKIEDAFVIKHNNCKKVNKLTDIDGVISDITSIVQDIKKRIS